MNNKQYDQLIDATTKLTDLKARRDTLAAFVKSFERKQSELLVKNTFGSLTYKLTAKTDPELFEDIVNAFDRAFARAGDKFNNFLLPGEVLDSQARNLNQQCHAAAVLSILDDEPDEPSEVEPEDEDDEEEETCNVCGNVGECEPDCPGMF